jgi:hypothetical protein
VFRRRADSQANGGFNCNRARREDFMHRFVWLVAMALFVMACGGTQAGRSATPGSQGTPGSQMTDPPGATAAITTQPNIGDNKSKAQSLIPQGSSAPINEVTIGNSYTVQVTSTMTLDQLAAFWTTAIPAAGMTETGRFNNAGSLIIAFTNPEGGVTASTTDNGVLISISVGTSS